MHILLTKHNRRMLLDLVELGGIVLCEDYFLIGFTAAFTGVYDSKRDGYWVNTSTTYGGLDEEYSFFIQEGCTLDVQCFMPILSLGLE